MMLFKKMCLVTVMFCLAITSVHATNKLSVFVSILPQQYFVQMVGSDHVDVLVMVGPGQNPATYEPTPQQMAALNNADIYFSIGVPFESAWLDKIKNNNKKLVVIECCELLADIHNQGHTHSHHDNFDPHIWTSPRKVILLTKLIEKSLMDIDGANRESYKSASAEFIVQLQNLDKLIQSKSVNLKKRDFIVSHPSWNYFAKHYGFTQIPIEQEGKEIQASSMVKLIKKAKERNIKAIFIQPQFNQKAANVIAKEINAKIFEIDPLAFNYIENMNDVIGKIVEGLSYE